MQSTPTPWYCPHHASRLALSFFHERQCWVCARRSIVHFGQTVQSWFHLTTRPSPSRLWACPHVISRTAGGLLCVSFWVRVSSWQLYLKGQRCWVLSSRSFCTSSSQVSLQVSGCLSRVLVSISGQFPGCSRGHLLWTATSTQICRGVVVSPLVYNLSHCWHMDCQTFRNGFVPFTIFVGSHNARSHIIRQFLRPWHFGKEWIFKPRMGVQNKCDVNSAPQLCSSSTTTIILFLSSETQKPMVDWTEEYWQLTWLTVMPRVHLLLHMGYQ